MKGFRTIAAGLAMVVLPVALTYLAGIDWTPYIGASGAFAVSGIITIALRLVTTTPVGKA
jgi:hypothetical protein